jgi:chemotaxis protein MotB
MPTQERSARSPRIARTREASCSPSTGPARRQVGQVLAAAAIAGLALVGSGCGYTEQQWQVQVDKLERERSQRDAAEDRLAKADAELAEHRGKVSGLEQRLIEAGVDVERLSTDLAGATSSLAERERAIAEYKMRAQKLEAIRARFESLRQKLAALTEVGLTVTVRKNRMVVALPGDVLFDSGKDKLKKGGRDVLKKVADAIRADPGLVAREYQVAGHTDSKKLQGGVFGDNLGLSTMRARQVVLYLTDPNEGGLPREKWSAAGYADTDPVASNDTDEGRLANRRSEIVVVPSVDELLDLKTLAGTPVPAKAAPVAPPATPPAAPPAKTAAPPAAPPARTAAPPAAPPAMTGAPPTMTATPPAKTPAAPAAPRTP